MFYSLFSQHAATRPDKVAVVCGRGRTTYREMSLSIDRAARNLLTIGVKSGELCCICFDNGVDYLILYYALARLGVRIMPLTSNMAPHEIESFCHECKPDYFVVHAPYLQKYLAIVASLGKGRLISEHTVPFSLRSIFQAEANSVVPLPDAKWTDQDLVIHYNTPNSSEPGQRFKGAVQTHESHAHRMLNWAQTAAITPNDSTLCMHPLMHAFGSEMFALPALSTGQTLYLLSAQEVAPETVAKAIQKNQATLFGALPWFYKELVELPEKSRADLSSLRVAMCAATPLSINVANDFLSIYGKRVSNSYGLTETSLIASNIDDIGIGDMLTVGQPIPNVEAKLRDCGLDIPGVGELLVRSNGFSVRYFAKDVPALWQDGWIHTGDLVRMNKAGGLHILGRVTHVIKTVGGDFLPLEVEEVLACYPKVKEVAVVPVAVGTDIQIAAFIVTHERISEEDIRRHVEQTLAKYKVPAFIRFCDALPKSATGKISRAKLRIEGVS